MAKLQRIDASVLARINKKLYKAIKTIQDDLFELKGINISFSEASRMFFEKNSSWYPGYEKKKRAFFPDI